MKRLKIRVDNEELLTLIESLQYETDSRKEILAFMIDRGMNGTENFDKYQEEYRGFFVQLNTAKSRLEEAIRNTLPEGMELRAWNLDFVSHEIAVDAYETQN